MASRTRLSASRRLALSFTLVLLVPASAVIWLGIRAVRDDGIQQAQAAEQRRERSATQIADGIAQAIRTTELQMSAAVDVLKSSLTGEDVFVAWQESVAEEAEPAVFEGAEGLEFQGKDLKAAKTAYEEYAKSSDPALRAGALLRLARVHHRLGESEAALSTLSALAREATARVAELPADLVARRARCDLLASLGHVSMLSAEATSLEADLIGLRWPLDPATWRQYAEEAARWAGTPAASNDINQRAPIAERLWERYGTSRAPASGRDLVSFGSAAPAVVLWQRSNDRFVALAAGTAFQTRQWFETSHKDFSEGLTVGVISQDGRTIWGSIAASSAGVVARRSLGESGLPWIVAVSSTSQASSAAALPTHRGLLVAGLALVVMVIAAGGYFVARAVRRELAIADMQSDFVSAVSHEFRTPLTSLRQFTDLLTAPNEPDTTKREQFHQAQRRATDRLQRLVESLLDFGRMEAGARAYDLTPERFDRLIGPVIEDFRREALPSGFTLNTSLQDGDVVVHAEASTFGRALWNLLDNAVKYSGDARTIAVRSARRGDAIAIDIADLGIGIPRDEQPHLFDKFFRGAESRTRGINGTGIGLAMVKQIVDAHRGIVAVSSVVGQGTTFTITLPVDPQVNGQ